MNGVTQELSHSQEQYLRVIYELSKTKPAVLQIDVARRLGRSKPSVCRAIALLRQKGLLDPAGRELVLTTKGMALAERSARIRERMREVLLQFGVDPDTAPDSAEEIAWLLGEAHSPQS